MAPRKEQKNPPSSPAPAVVVRVTRSSTAANRGGAPPLADPAEEVAAKKRKVAASKGKKRDAADPSLGGEGKDSGAVAKKKKKKADEPDGGAAVDPSSRTIVIEACKQCNSFKTRALMVKEKLEGAFSGITVNVNPDKPRRGYFEIRDICGDVFLSLPSMERPFKPMKALDMEKVVNDIIKRIRR